MSDGEGTEKEAPSRSRDDRPAYRLLRDGPRSLSDADLIATLLHGSCRGDALEVATDLLNRTDGLAGLFASDDGRLDLPRVGKVRAATILAVREIASRLWRAELVGREVLNRPGAIANYLLLRYGIADQEVLGALFLDRRHCLMSEKEIFRGTLTQAKVEPRQVLRAALRQTAAGVVIFHTHPSGDPTPSAEDLAFTGRMEKAGKVVGVELVDHLIVGGFGRWVSLKERGAL